MGDGSTKPIESIRSWRRRDVELRQRRLPPVTRAAHAHGSGWRECVEDHPCQRPQYDFDPRSRALRRIRARPDAAAAHDVRDVEGRRRLPDRDFPHVHGRPAEELLGSDSAVPSRACRCGVGRVRPRHRSGGALARGRTWPPTYSLPTLPFVARRTARTGIGTAWSVIKRCSIACSRSSTPKAGRAAAR